jgi:hypothetical protein
MRQFLCALGVLLTPLSAAASTLTIRDAQGISTAGADLVSVGAMLKFKPDPRFAPPGVDYSGPQHEVCMLNLRLADSQSFQGISALAMSANVAAAMQTPKDEDMALQSAAMGARDLQNVLASAKALAETTMLGCRQFPDVQNVGPRLISAITAAAEVTARIVEKVKDVQIDEGGHQN